MNLLVLAALVAVCGAAKLDRTYLPPASAKTAGGSPGSLQTPFSGNSFNNGLGGLPKGSFENDSEGVVVDAAIAGTRASGESGLGAPRISYGSSNSKVGSAAFKTRPSAFNTAASTSEDSQGSSNAQESFNTASQGFGQAGSQGFQQAGAQAFQQSSQEPERARASVDRAASILRYESDVGPENYHFAYETDNGISAEENGVATNGVQAQGGFSYTGDDGQVYSVSYTADEKGYQPKGDHLPTPPPIPEEILRSLEQNAKDEAAGLIDDGSYDAQKYNAGSDYVESDGANGKTQQPAKFGGSDAETSGSFINQNQVSKAPSFGQSGFNAQAGQGSAVAEQSNRFSGQASSGSTSGQNVEQESEQSQNNFAGQFGQNNGASRPGSSGQYNGASSRPESSGQFSQTSGAKAPNNGFGSFAGASEQSGSNQGNAFGNRNEYLPPTGQPAFKPQSGRPQNERPQSSSASFSSQGQTSDDDSASSVPLGQQDLQEESRPKAPINSFGNPISTDSGDLSQNGFSSGVSGSSSAQNGFGSSNQKRPTNGQRPSSNSNGNSFSQGQPGFSSQNGFNSQNSVESNNQKRPTNGRRPSSNDNGNIFFQGQSSQSANRPNEYLPPTGSNQNQRPSAPPQAPENTQFTQQYNMQSQSSQDAAPTSFSTPTSTGSQSSIGTQSSQFSGFQQPQSSKPQNGNSFSSQGQVSSSSPTFGFNTQKATAQPETELTTPFEDSSTSQSSGQSTGTDFTSASSPSNGRPTQSSFSNQYNTQNNFGARPQGPARPFGTQAPAFPNPPSIGQYNPNSQFGNQAQTQNTFAPDAQFAPSTQRPTYAQQPQGSDDSYYYNQPAKPFGTPQASRFPSAPSNQINGVTQQSAFGQNRFSSSPSEVPSTAFPFSQFESTKLPRPSMPGKPGSQNQGQFGSNYQGSSKAPRLPIVAAPNSALQSQSQSGAVNGVTQATVSRFPPQTPTQSSQYNTQTQFGSRPSFQQNRFSQMSQSSSMTFGQQPTQSSFGQQTTANAFPQRPTSSSIQFGQQTQGEDQSQDNKGEQPVATQQYAGEIYEYNKPAQTLPPPDSTPASSTEQERPTQVPFGQSRPQFGQNDNLQMPQGSRPQFGAQTKPQFGQNAQTHNNFGARPQPTQDYRPYGALAQMTQGQTSQPRPFGTQPSRPQFGPMKTFIPPGAESTQQPGEDQGLNADSQSQTSKNQFGFVSPCCKDNFGKKPQTSQGQFGGQFSKGSFFGAQQQSSSSFAGKGEQFGGPRAPPSFDEQTGYHY